MSEQDKPPHAIKVVLTDNLTIEIINHGTWIYEIDLERCRNSAEVLDWLYQVLYKEWCSPQVIFDIMWKIEEAVRQYHQASVQGAFCGLGKNRKVKWPFMGSYIEGT